jgi:DNA invertase Pin-like site-specific DNA recombinase
MKQLTLATTGFERYAKTTRRAAFLTEMERVVPWSALCRKDLLGHRAQRGVKTERTQLRRILDQLDAGDVLMVTRLDRLARSTRDLLNTLAAIADRKAGFRSLGDTWADTTTAHGRLMLTVLGGLAEFERDLIRARTSEGRERAKARGVKLGRKPKLTEHQKREAIRRRDVDGETVREIARSYNVSHSTISRLTAS